MDESDSPMQLSMDQTTQLLATNPPTAGSPAAGCTTSSPTAAAPIAAMAVDYKNSDRNYYIANVWKFLVWLIFKGESEMPVQCSSTPAATADYTGNDMLTQFSTSAAVSPLSNSSSFN